MYEDQIKYLARLTKSVQEADPIGVDDDLTEAFLALRKARNALLKVTLRANNGFPVGSSEVSK